MEIRASNKPGSRFPLKVRIVVEGHFDHGDRRYRTQLSGVGFTVLVTYVYINVIFDVDEHETVGIS